VAGTKRRGRPPADLTDIDDVAVKRVIDGEPVTLSRSDRVAAVRALVAREMPKTHIAARVGTSLRTVHRDVALIRRGAA
jgi:hypothetical protein